MMLARLSLVILTVLLYLQTVKFEFTHQEQLRIVEDPVVAAASFSAQNFLAPFRRPTFPGNFYQPVTDLSFHLNYLTTGPDPYYFHLTNVILHLLCVLLAFEVLLLFCRGPALAWVAAAWFAIHPAQVETTVNLSARAEMLGALFAMIALICFVRANRAARRSSHSSLFAPAGLSLFLACLSNESALPFLVLIPLAAFYLRKRYTGISRLGLAYLLLAVVASSILRLAILGSCSFYGGSPIFTYANPLAAAGVDGGQRLIGGLKVLGDYIQLLVAPLRLSADYPSTSALFWGQVYSLHGILSMVLIVLWLLAVYQLRKKSWTFLGFWFPLSFLLTSNILFPTATLMADRLLYLPSLGGLGFLVCWADSAFLKGMFGRLCAAFVVLATSLIITLERIALSAPF